MYARLYRWLKSINKFHDKKFLATIYLTYSPSRNKLIILERFPEFCASSQTTRQNSGRIFFLIGLLGRSSK